MVGCCHRRLQVGHGNLQNAANNDNVSNRGREGRTRTHRAEMSAYTREAVSVVVEGTCIVYHVCYSSMWHTADALANSPLVETSEKRV